MLLSHEIAFDVKVSSSLTVLGKKIATMLQKPPKLKKKDVTKSFEDVKISKKILTMLNLQRDGAESDRNNEKKTTWFFFLLSMKNNDVYIF